MELRRSGLSLLLLGLYIILATAQPDTIVIGFGAYGNVGIEASHSVSGQEPDNTLNQDGYLPNENAASRFLSQTTMGYNMSDIDLVTMIGIEDWLDNQLAIPRGFRLRNQVDAYRDFAIAESGNPSIFLGNRLWDYSYWQYTMTEPDALRQRVAFALSQLVVISQNSIFNNNSYALSDYYDIILDNAFGDYLQLLREVTYHPSMGRYLTYLNNTKTDLAKNQFPDENYAREIMQLMTIGTTMLNMDGTEILDTAGVPIPTYDNYTIAELSKIFTGLTWGDRTQWNRGPLNDTSYALPMHMFNDHHEPGVKYLISGDSIMTSPVNGDVEIEYALVDLFNHPNVPPFVSKFLIQRLVTSNPSPAYVERVANVFANNGEAKRGHMPSVIKAIFLDPEAKACDAGEALIYGALREPFVRYVQINKAFEATTESGNYRNDMDYIYRFTGQRPLASPSVFNFFQQDYQPIGPIEDNNLVAPVFQITDAQTISGYINSLYRFIMQENIADEYDLYNGEPDSTYTDERSNILLADEVLLTDDDQLHILLDRLNLLLAQGRISDESLQLIKSTVTKFDNDDADDKRLRAKLAIYLTLTSPEYLINR